MAALTALRLEVVADGGAVHAVRFGSHRQFDDLYNPTYGRSSRIAMCRPEIAQPTSGFVDGGPSRAESVRRMLLHAYAADSWDSIAVRLRMAISARSASTCGLWRAPASRTESDRVSACTARTAVDRSSCDQPG